jgi:hypothetical protein
MSEVRCRQCSEMFASTDDLIRHMGDKHQKRAMSDQPETQPATERARAEQSPIEQLGELLKEAGAQIQIGLKAQGKFDKVRDMLNAGATVNEIGQAIGWDGLTAVKWFAREAAHELDAPVAPLPERAQAIASMTADEALKELEAATWMYAEEHKRPTSEAAALAAVVRAAIAAPLPDSERAQAEHIAGLFEALGVREGATLQTIQRASGVNTANAMRLMSLFYTVRSMSPLPDSERETALRAAVVAFLAKWELVEPRIGAMFSLNYARTQRQYDGPNLVEELANLRAALLASPETKE